MFWKKKEVATVAEPAKTHSDFFSTDAPNFRVPRKERLQVSISKSFQKTAADFPIVSSAVAMDSQESIATDSIQTAPIAGGYNWGGVPDAQIGWYGSQGFIGYQMCAMMAQQWLISKVCGEPARDALRKGFEITVNDGTEVDPKILEEIRKIDKRMKLNENLEEFVKFSRVFGIRLAMFSVTSTDPEYYEKPFNLDGVTPGSYNGIIQIDPYWITPLLDSEAVTNPASMNFYVPTWWTVNGRRIHRSHLIISIGDEVADTLKPSYLYGGISVPQKIYERVYAAERTANEAPMLAMTKRLNVRKIDTAAALANQAAFEERMNYQMYLRDNYGTVFAGLNEDVDQLETSLSDLDEVIMTQYQLVAGASGYPSTKMIGTTPKGFNSTGEAEEANYHEMLESIQTHDCTPLIERHHQLVIRSIICPKFNIAPFETAVTWEPLDSLTAKEAAEIEKIKAETGQTLVNAGAIDGTDERQRLINDPQSGYNGIPEEIEEEELDPEAEPTAAENLDPDADETEKE